MNKFFFIFIFITLLIKSHFIIAEEVSESNWITKKKSITPIEGFCSDKMSIEQLNLESDKFYDENIFNKSYKFHI